MIGLDTNVVVRFVMQDDPVQSPLATKLFDSFTTESPGFVSLVTLIEAVLGVRSSYDAKREHIQRGGGNLLRSKGVRVERRGLMWGGARGDFRGGRGFADFLAVR